jgi:hypothetical protein
MFLVCWTVNCLVDIERLKNTQLRYIRLTKNQSIDCLSDMKLSLNPIYFSFVKKVYERRFPLPR